jgi:hypothetical protein
MERMMGFEPTTSTLARLRSTPELHPLGWVSGPEPAAGEIYTPVAGKSNLYFGNFPIRIRPFSAELHQCVAYQ